jgi:F-type H+-transporting ATPase subunit a
LPVRLFANMTAGHILLKIIVGFVWVLFISLSSSSSTIFTETIICLCCIVMVVFIIMEIIMAVLQAYVFATLLVIYNKDASTLAKY